MEPILISSVIIVAFIVGLIIGNTVNKVDNTLAVEICNQHYNDMKNFTNQFANLSVQLHNQNMNNAVGAEHRQQAEFPTPEEMYPPASDGEPVKDEDEVLAEMTGGRL